jgi:hypothetical protein
VRREVLMGEGFEKGGYGEKERFFEITKIKRRKVK